MPMGRGNRRKSSHPHRPPPPIHNNNNHQIDDNWRLKPLNEQAASSSSSSAPQNTKWVSRKARDSCEKSELGKKYDVGPTEKSKGVNELRCNSRGDGSCEKGGLQKEEKEEKRVVVDVFDDKDLSGGGDNNGVVENDSEDKVGVDDFVSRLEDLILGEEKIDDLSDDVLGINDQLQEDEVYFF